VSERAMIIASVALCILLIGTVAGRESCRIGWAEGEVCTWLTRPGVSLGPLLRY